MSTLVLLKIFQKFEISDMDSLKSEITATVSDSQMNKLAIVSLQSKTVLTDVLLPSQARQTKRKEEKSIQNQAGNNEEGDKQKEDPIESAMRVKPSKRTKFFRCKMMTLIVEEGKKEEDPWLGDAGQSAFCSGWVWDRNEVQVLASHCLYQICISDTIVLPLAVPVKDLTKTDLTSDRFNGNAWLEKFSKENTRDTPINFTFSS